MKFTHLALLLLPLAGTVQAQEAPLQQETELVTEGAAASAVTNELSDEAVSE